MSKSLDASAKVFKISLFSFFILIFLFPYNKAISANLTDLLMHTQTFESNSIRNYFVKNDMIRQNLLMRPQNLYKLTHLSSKNLGVYLAQGEEEEDIFEDVYAFESKSIKKAFLYSFVLPGAGEFYSNSKIKAGLFLGLEALFWTGYFGYHKRGSDKRDEYQVWADQYWDRNRYEKGLFDTYGDTVLTLQKDSTYKLISLDGLDSISITHWLSDSEDQQYYEMIGKYHQFRYGWEDYNSYDREYWTLLRLYYWEMRKHSNRLFDRAKYTMIASLANHVLSAFDAALTARSYNKKGERFSAIRMKVRLAEYERELVPFLSLSMRF